MVFVMSDGNHSQRPIRVGWRSFPAHAPDGAVSAIEPAALPGAAPHTRDWLAGSFVIRAPFGFRARIEVREDSAGLVWLDNPSGRPPFEVISMTPRNQWRAPDRPSIQWLVNSMLVADEPVMAETLAPFLSPSMRRWPGVLVPGSIDILRWTRPFQWVFEWQDLDAELSIEAGQPIQMVRLHAPDPDARFALVPLPDSHELRQAQIRCARIAPFKRNALGHADEAYARRPAKLVPETP